MEPPCNYSWSLSQVPAGPLAPHIDCFIILLCNQGYAPNSAHLKVRLVVDFSHWLKQQAIELNEITAEHITYYLQYRAHHQRPRPDDTFTLRQYLKLLHQKGIIAEEEEPGEMTPIGRLAEEFAL